MFSSEWVGKGRSEGGGVRFSQVEEGGREAGRKELLRGRTDVPRRTRPPRRRGGGLKGLTFRVKKHPVVELESHIPPSRSQHILLGSPIIVIYLIRI